MIGLMEPFDEPIDSMKALLGSSFEKEYFALSNLCGLIKMNHPKKILKVGGANNSTTAAILRCIDILQLPCQLHVIDSCDKIPPYTKDVFDLEAELEQRNSEFYHIYKKHTLASYIGEIGCGVDLMILDAAETMPYDILDFITAFPYLSPNAIVALCSTFSDRFPKNILFQNVTADKFSTCLPLSIDFQSCIKFIETETISIFQISENTAQHILDLFAVLHQPWPHAPTLEHLLEYEALIKYHYNSMCLKLYKQAVLEADPYKKMLKAMVPSLLEAFSQVLLYGKRQRGRYFLKFAELIDFPVTGFVVSDGRDNEKTFENLPVYSYSKIPFPSNEVFIFQTTSAIEVEQQLRKSKFHWMGLPDCFWNDCNYENYLQSQCQYAKLVSDEKTWAWNKGTLNL